MSITEASAGEVVDVLEADAALNLVALITAQNRRVNVEAGALVELVAEALKGRAWIPLGYGSWDELVTEMGWEFRPTTTEDRAELVRSMRESGMSLRAIGRTVGTSQQTVMRDLGSGVPSGTPEITGTDGKTYSPTRPVRHQEMGGGDDGEPLDGDANPASEPIGDGADSHDVGRSEPEPPPELDSASIRRETKKLRDAKKAELREKDHGPELSASAQTILDEAYNIDRRPTQIANDLHRATMLFTAWRPETIHDVNDPDITKGVDDLIEVAGRWIERFNASRPKPFDVIKGDAR